MKRTGEPNPRDRRTSLLILDSNGRRGHSIGSLRLGASSRAASTSSASTRRRSASHGIGGSIVGTIRVGRTGHSVHRAAGTVLKVATLLVEATSTAMVMITTSQATPVVAVEGRATGSDNAKRFAILLALSFPINTLVGSTS